MMTTTKNLKECIFLNIIKKSCFIFYITLLLFFYILAKKIFNKKQILYAKKDCMLAKKLPSKKGVF